MLDKIEKECNLIIDSFDADKDKERVLNQLYGFLHGIGSLGLLKEWYGWYKGYEISINKRSDC